MIKWINKSWYVHITEYYSEVKRNEISVHCYSVDELSKQAK